jgi:transcriptional regulator with XRE-family HTH domain
MGERIVRLREEKGWDRGELARRLGVTRARLKNWERGTNTPPVETLIALGGALEVSLDELATGEAAGRLLSEEECQWLGERLALELAKLRRKPAADLDGVETPGGAEP